ncbi:MAG: hypothetical protein ACOCWL_02030 [Thermoguttaceae bacterium]
MVSLHTFRPLGRPTRSRAAAVPPSPAALGCVAAVLLVGAVAWLQTGGAAGQPAPSAEQAAPDAAAEEDTPSAEKRKERLREGTELVDQPGVFRMAGDRMTFFTDLGEGRFVVLENLILERVGDVIGEYQTPPYWSVTGTLTEYQGENFLLIHRAVLSNNGAEKEDGVRSF